MTPERQGTGRRGEATGLRDGGFPAASRVLPPYPGNGHLVMAVVWWQGDGDCPPRARSPSPRAQPMRPRVRFAGQPRPPGVPPGQREVPHRVSPQPADDPRRRAGEESWGPAGSRLGSSTYLGRRRAPAGPQPGRAGARERGARAEGALPWSRVFGAAALGVPRLARTIPRGRRAGAGSRDPRDFLLRGVSSEPLAQRPHCRRASLGFH